MLQPGRSWDRLRRRQNLRCATRCRLGAAARSGSGVCHQAYFEDQDGNALILHHRYAPPVAG